MRISTRSIPVTNARRKASLLGLRSHRQRKKNPGRNCRDRSHQLSELLLAGLADARCLAQLLRHLQMMLQCGEGLASPILQLGIVAALGITLEQRYRVLMSADLIGVEVRAEILARSALELVEHALVRAVELRRQLGLDLAAIYHALQLGAGLGVVGHHLLRE